jgi:predicted Ser/Thr protein kinase
MENAMESSVSKPFTNKILINRKKILGEGSSAVVYQGTYKDQEVAVKRIELEKSLTEEFTRHKKIQHKNVLKMLAVEHDKDFR